MSGFMSMRRTAALLAGLLLAAVFANATTETRAIRIKVLDSETHTLNLADGDVPKNCDQVNFDAYCNNSRTTVVTNTLLVQEDNGTAYRVTCTIDSRFSRCVPLPKGETFEAKKVKHGVTVYYIDDKGKARSQLYTLVDMGRRANPPATAVAVVPPPASLAPAPSAHAAAPVSSSPAAAPDPPPAAREVLPEKAEKAKVQCDFTSNPAGAEITLDGNYVGNTPSEIAVTTGTHTVVFSLGGFTQWKRELTVLPGSALTVSAILQKETQ
jgi:PEGA domain-containing protein